MTLPVPFNNEHVCVVCRSRAAGFAVGDPRRLGWFCEACDTDLAKEVYRMSAKTLDSFERMAIDEVAKIMPQGEVVIDDHHKPDLIEWIIQTFGEKIRELIENDKAPF